MRNVQRVLLAVLCLLIVLAILAFVLENQQPVSLVFLGWTGPELRISLVVVIAMLAGMVLGPTLGWLIRRLPRAPRKRLA
ncbi:lipopolysaccharide assembly protein LapA domain-containing protein [Pseudomonas fluorescens]|uniref:lipopolysaccharide assembly protein LapA domain-containing protein n=1 Tax=Pseudomonas fluorescens TaxID=294 RepID=UPI001241653E|nr:lipopolysaccharide assembly protein LapA domain-containing protein [Pseudomonas fluorescens]